MPAQTANLFLLQDLENSSRTAKLADRDLSALRAVADWIETFVARPNEDLGRAGLGEFHERNEGSAIRNLSFHPFKAPVPFLLMRHAVISDWMFFLDNEDWLGFWARRFGESPQSRLLLRNYAAPTGGGSN